MRHSSTSNEKYVLEMIGAALRESHGLPGALGFMCLNDKTRVNHQIPSLLEASYRLILDWAALGIMMHDIEGLYWDDKRKITPKNPLLRLSFDVDPLSSLISMADILEEFQRPAAIFKSNLLNVSKVDLFYGFPCIETRIRIRDGVLHIFYRYDSIITAAENRQRRIDEVNEYFDPSNGYVDLTPLGIKDVVCMVE